MTTRAAVLLWDYDQPIDLDKLARVVGVLSGGRVHLQEVDTGGQEIALVVSNAALSGETAAGVFDGWYLNQTTTPEVFDVRVGGDG